MGDHGAQKGGRVHTQAVETIHSPKHKHMFTAPNIVVHTPGDPKDWRIYTYIYVCIYKYTYAYYIYIYIYYTHICYTFIIYIYIYCHFVVQSSPIDHGDPSCRQLGNVPVAMALIDHSRNRKIT